MLSDKKTKEILEKNNLLGPEDIAKRASEAEKKNIQLDDYLLQAGVITEDILYNAVAITHAVPFINLKDQAIDPDVLFLIPEPIAATYHIIAFAKTSAEISVAMIDPDDIQTIEFIKRKVNVPVKVHVATPSAIADAAKAYHKSLENELSGINKKTNIGVGTDLPQKGGAKAGPDLENLAKDVPVIRVVDTLLEYAIFEGASDIHIEPAEKALLIRFRIDGILREVMSLPRALSDGIVARIKILSNLKLDEHRLPQDGRFKIEAKDYKISFRVSIIPVFDGEKVVMRLLDEGKKMLDLPALGLNTQALASIKQNIAKPHGMILVTGPTGSGKTTTLYTMMHLLNTPKVNIATIEDPIEYRMPRINQSQVAPKIEFTFARGLRALLRQDPDIIMVGEIRDAETAGIAINAAMTGHLVLSTLHTNDAPTTLPRLVDMGIEPFLVATTVNVILAQRLLRKLCKNCLTSYNLAPEELQRLEKDHGLNLQSIGKTFARAEGSTAASADLGSVLFFKGKGCNKCGNQGYKGRVGIYEALEMTEEMKHLVSSGATAEAIRDAARKAGMITILEDGFLKAKQGITSIEEVLRVTKE
ncbi:MAG: ATPase, T2SS/T4P/T4SS family, partial [Patescibacteria group bacterium]|nr:ATPase, T2SS/T4P/T4SS family [bacterium]MDZ4221312.1 ATPase, T2SS/T4P/T4SS family [Patescibacteria group bacterium]